MVKARHPVSSRYIVETRCHILVKRWSWHDCHIASPSTKPSSFYGDSSFHERILPGYAWLRYKATATNVCQPNFAYRIRTPRNFNGVNGINGILNFYFQSEFAARMWRHTLHTWSRHGSDSQFSCLDGLKFSNVEIFEFFLETSRLPILKKKQVSKLISKRKIPRYSEILVSKCITKIFKDYVRKPEPLCSILPLLFECSCYAKIKWCMRDLKWCFRTQPKLRVWSDSTIVFKFSPSHRMQNRNTHNSEQLIQWSSRPNIFILSANIPSVWKMRSITLSGEIDVSPGDVRRRFGTACNSAVRNAGVPPRESPWRIPRCVYIIFTARLCYGAIEVTTVRESKTSNEVRGGETGSIT